MLKTLSAIALGSALLLAPAVALADMSTTQPSPYVAKAPGNGPDVRELNQWRGDRYYGGAWEGRSAAESPTFYHWNNQ